MRECGDGRLGDRVPVPRCVSYRTAIVPPRPRTHWWPVILATSSVVTWYGGDLVAKACKTYWVRLAGRCLGMSSAS